MTILWKQLPGGLSRNPPVSHCTKCLQGVFSSATVMVILGLGIRAFVSFVMLFFFFLLVIKWNCPPSQLIGNLALGLGGNELLFVSSLQKTHSPRNPLFSAQYL